MMKRWEEYQHQAAALLREVGFSTEINARLVEPNGTAHAIDVVGRRMVAGVDLLWIVECKYWNRRVPIEKVLTLRSLVLDLGADRGLLMSESGFQSGAIRTASQKNITLTSLNDLRANAADDILAARVAAAEKSLMDLSLRVNRDLRPSAVLAPRMLATFAARIPPEVVEGYAARPKAVDFSEGISEVWSHAMAAGVTTDDVMPFVNRMDDWRSGVDRDVMEYVASAIDSATVALYQGRLGYWPALCPVGPLGREGTLSWSMTQLIPEIESVLPDLDQEVRQQEAEVAKAPQALPTSPWGRLQSGRGLELRPDCTP